MPSEPKTKPTDASVDDFIASVDHTTRRADAQAVQAAMTEITGLQPVMWGASIVGYGSYRAASGDWPLIGFSPRKANLVLYLMPGFEQHSEQLARLGKHKTGASCLYLNKLADIDVTVLRELIDQSFQTMRQKYPQA